jgi:hypothetical protein
MLKSLRDVLKNSRLFDSVDRGTYRTEVALIRGYARAEGSRSGR